MQWTLICCFLLASAHDIASTARPKRDLWSIKNLLSSKLFGTETVVVQLPKIPKNETYRLFKINGYDNVFLKVIRKPEKEVEKHVKIQFENPAMMRPEIDIISNYLGTPTQKETLLALEIAKNLLMSGILKGEREKVVQQVVMAPQNPYDGYVVREPIKPAVVIPEVRDPIYVDSPVVEAETINFVNRRPVAVYPAEQAPMIVATEVKYRPFQTKYKYKQETENADMTFESYNNRGVVVTRTNKVPVKPQYIAVRLADVVSLAANPYLISTQRPVSSTVVSEEHLEEKLHVVPIHSYVMEKIRLTTPCPKVEEESGYVDSSYFTRYSSSSDRNPPKVAESLTEEKFLDVPNFIQHSKLPFDIRDHLSDGEIDRLNEFINAKLYLSKNNGNINHNGNYATLSPITQIPYNNENYSDGGMKKVQKAVPSQTSPGKIITRYSYKQLGDNSQSNYTHVRIEDPKLNQSKINLESGNGLPENFVYVPPGDFVPPTENTNNIKTNVSLPMPNANSINHAKISPPMPNTYSIPDQSSHIRYDEYDNFNNDAETYAKTSAPLTLRGDLEQPDIAANKPGRLKTNDQHSITNNPIVVPDFGHEQNKVSTYKGGVKTSSSSRPYTEGQRTNKTSKTNSEKSYTGESWNRNH